MPGIPHVYLFDPATLVAETHEVPVEKRIRGNPRQTVWPHFSDPGGQFFTGIWHSEPGKWHIRYSEQEYCRILEGVSVIADQDGRELTVRAGDEFVIPRGFIGTWEVVDATRKVYVIHESGVPLPDPE